MRGEILIVALGGMLALASQAARADEQSTLQELLAENKNLTLQLEKAKKVEGEIAKAELAIQGAQSALNRAKAELRRSGTGLVDEARNLQQQSVRAGCPWGAKSTDLAFVNSCNAEGRRLMDLFADVQRRGGDLQEYAQKLEEKQGQFSERTVRLFTKKKENRTDLETLFAAREDWLRRYRAFVFQSEAYNRLRVTAPSANLCARNSSSLEDASQCLQWVWDGARR